MGLIPGEQLRFLSPAPSQVSREGFLSEPARGQAWLSRTVGS